MRQDLLLSAALLWALGASFGLVARHAPKSLRHLPNACGAVGGSLVATVGVLSVLGSPLTVDLGPTLGFGQTLVRLDALAGMFLTLVGALAALTSSCWISWSATESSQSRFVGPSYMLLLGALVVVIVAGDAFTFLFGWESLTLSFYLLTAAGRGAPRAKRRGSWITLAVGKASGAFLLIGFMLLGGREASYLLDSWSRVPPGALRDAAYSLIVAGFAAKVGVLPFQVWIPLGYPAAPAPARAALAGLGANAGFYGLWRFLSILGPPPVALAIVVLLLGGVTALVGISFASVQSDLNRLVAYSSIENAGLIVVGYGIALSGAALGQEHLVAVGLLAATLQTLSHAVAKTGLFASSAFFTRDWGTSALDDLRGVVRTHPAPGAAFGFGSLTLAGLPPSIGFVSEWFLLEALMQEFRLPGLAVRLAMAGAGALVALTAGVAAFTFARLVGLTVLSKPLRPDPERRRRSSGSWLGGSSLVFLGFLCVGLAAAAPWTVRFIAGGLSPVVPARLVEQALKSPWVLQPVYANFSILSPSWLAVVLPVAFVSTTAMAFLLSRGTAFKVRRVTAWRSATEGVQGPDRYSSFAYANALRHVLANLLGTKLEVVAVEPETASGVDRPPSLEVRSEVVEPVEKYFYTPLRRGFLLLAGQARRLQSGRLDAYISYVLVTLVVVIAVAALG